jgi:hypothetical protein
MKSAQQPHATAPSSGDAETVTRLLLLPDGRVLAHNLTPWMAQILQQLAPGDLILEQRQGRSPHTTAPNATPPETDTP